MTTLRLKSIIAFLIIGFFLLAISVFALTPVIFNMPPDRSIAGINGFGSMLSGIVGIALGYLFRKNGSASSEQEVTKTQVAIAIIFISVYLVTTTIVGVIPYYTAGSELTEHTQAYSDLLKTYGSVMSGLVGIIIGFLFGR